MKKRQIYPFSAIVGQSNMRMALLLNAVNPGIGGVLVRGEKGTGKSTAARGLAELLPALDVVSGCPYALAPDEVPTDLWPNEASGVEQRAVQVIDLPLGVTEDRLLGTINLEQAIQQGKRQFEPGLLAQAHRGILYIDEVNLLGDHIVDVLLDAAAMGTNIVEREGVSFSHPARFILVGTMNPEEGDLRPQLLDRFGLAVQVEGPVDVGERTEIVRRRLAFEETPTQFIQRFKKSDEQLRQHILDAQRRLPLVTVDERMMRLIAKVCMEFDVDGMRADLVIYKTARTIAAWRSQEKVGAAEIKLAAELALPHRRRKQPFEQAGLDTNKLDDVIKQALEATQDGQEREGETAGEPQR
jgi:Mg-chelatase subunit ChlI